MAILLFSSDAHVDKVLWHGMNIVSGYSGCIVLGKMIDNDKKPFAAVLNRSKKG